MLRNKTRLAAEALDTNHPCQATLRLFRRESPVRVLGPYARAVIWVQGCHFHCPGCIVPESWDSANGFAAPVSELAEWAVTQPADIEGITLSGGEPLNQAGVLCGLIDKIQSRRDMGVVCYTGYTLDYLRERGSLEQQALLRRIDLLIDGVYQAGLHGNLLWRGSANQRIQLLTPRYAAVVENLLDERGDRSAGVEAVIDGDGTIGLAGVPFSPMFREEFLRRMSARGIRIAAGDGQREQQS